MNMILHWDIDIHAQAEPFLRRAETKAFTLSKFYLKICLDLLRLSFELIYAT